jgi:putative membrane protein
MKLPELKEKLKSKYIVRVVAGVLTIALVGTGIGATAVFAEKGSTAVTAEADSTTDSSKDADDIADKLMDSVSLKDNDADKDESVYLISDANGNVNKTIVVDHLKNKDKKDTLEDASNLSDIENVKGKEKFTQSGDKLTWQAGGKDIYYQGTATEEPPVTQKVTYYLDGKEISPEDLAGKSGKVKIRFDYTNTTSYTETVNGEKQTVSVPFAAVTGLVLGDGFENIEVTNGKAEVSDSSSVVLGYALPGLKDSLGIKDKDLDGDVNIPEYMEMTADVENFSMPAAMTFVVNASDYVSTDGIDTSDIDDMINDLKDASTQLQDGSKTLAEGTDTLADGLSTLQSKLGTFASGVGTLKSGLKTYTDGASTLSGGLNTLGNSTGALVSGADKLNSGAGQLASGSATLKDGLKSYTDGASQLNAGINELGSKSGTLVSGVSKLSKGTSALNAGVQELDKTLQAGPTDEQKNTIKSTAVQTVKDSFAGETGNTVKTTIYNGLRYGTDKNGNVVDGELYTSLYKGTASQNFEKNLDSTYKVVVNSILSSAANVKAGEVDSNTLASQIKQAYKKTSDDYANAINVATQNGTIDASTQKILANDNYKKAFVDYNAIQNMSASQLAEFLYSKNGTSDTLLNMTQTQLENVLSSDDIKKQINAGVESALNTLAEKLSGACEQVSETVAATAAVSGASETMNSIHAKINAQGLVSGVAELNEGVNGENGLIASMPTLTSGIKQLVDGSNTLVANNDTLNAGATALNAGASQLSAGTQSLMNSVPTLTSGIKQLVDGSNTLVANNAQLNSGASQLADGTNQIVSGVDQLTTGSKTLSEGAHTLADGMVQFNEEGINKILDAYNGDLKPFTDKLQAVIDAGEEYQTYSAIADGQTGSVKFIYKLASIDAKADSDK